LADVIFCNRSSTIYRTVNITNFITKIMYNYFVRCEDVGLDCNCTIYRINKETVIYNTAVHMFERHAIKLEEMTSCMKLKIKANVRLHNSPLPKSPGLFKSHF
jgi:predicted small metal-binding protein